MQITAAAGSHWPRRAHLMAARARRMAAGPRAAGPACASAPSARPRAGSRQRVPGSAAPLSGPLRAPALPPRPPAPLPGCTVIAPRPRAPLPLPSATRSPRAPGTGTCPAHAARRPARSCSPGVGGRGGPSAGGRSCAAAAAAASPEPGPAHRCAPESGAATWPRLHLLAPRRRGRPGCDDGDPGPRPLRQVVGASEKLSPREPDRR